MSKPVQRVSQLISTFGPGAMIDLPTRSVLVRGLEGWDIRGDAYRPIDEPRLTEFLEKALKEKGRFPEDKKLRLLAPPVLIPTAQNPDSSRGDSFRPQYVNRCCLH
jgi:hypothetical protein